MKKIEVGDYVIATKYHDGDPGDHFAVGWVKGITSHEPPRYDVADANGDSYRGNGFRRVREISAERGEWLVKHMPDIEASGRSVWGFVRMKMK